MQKEELIRDLAASFGMVDVHGSKFAGSKYDAVTGTFYCNGITIPATTVDKAKQHYKAQMDYYSTKADQSSEMMELFLINTVAYNAICLLEDNIDRD